MIKLTERIRSLIYSKRNSKPSETVHFDFVTSRKGIQRELLISKESGNIIGIYCRAFGEGMFLTVVTDVQINREGEIAVFNPYDASGKRLIRNTIEIEEIQIVCPFHKPYRNPVIPGNVVAP